MLLHYLLRIFLISGYVCMCVCIHTYEYIYIHVYVYVHMHKSKMYMFICIHQIYLHHLFRMILISEYTHICVCIYINIYIQAVGAVAFGITCAAVQGRGLSFTERHCAIGKIHVHCFSPARSCHGRAAARRDALTLPRASFRSQPESRNR